MATANRDRLQRFPFENLPIRGELAQLDIAWRTMLERRAYPPAVRQALGVAVAAAVLLSASIKFDGRPTLQIQARGPLRLLVVTAGIGRARPGATAVRRRRCEVVRAAGFPLSLHLLAGAHRRHAARAGRGRTPAGVRGTGYAERGLRILRPPPCLRPHRYRRTVRGHCSGCFLHLPLNS